MRKTNLSEYVERKLLLCRKLEEYRELLGKTIQDGWDGYSDSRPQCLRDYEKKGIRVKHTGLLLADMDRTADRFIEAINDWARWRGIDLKNVPKGGIPELEPLLQGFRDLDSETSKIVIGGINHLKSAEVVVWKRDLFRTAIACEGITNETRIPCSILPTAPQIWLAEGNDFSCEVELKDSLLDAGEEPVVGQLVGIYLYPVPINSTNTHWMCASLLLLPTGGLRMIPQPLVTFANAWDGWEDLPARITHMASPGGMGAIKPFYEEMLCSPIATDSQGPIFNATSGSLSKCVCAALWFMNQECRATARMERGEGVVREGGKSKRVPHASTIKHVELRRAPRRVSHKPSETGRQYSCQWWVEQHFRTYKEPIKTGKNEGKQTLYIAGYWKGPEDAPIKPRAERVITVSR